MLPFLRQSVVRIPQGTMLEREAAGADAAVEPVAQALEPRDPRVELDPPAFG
jgi:hypothetical protein